MINVGLIGLGKVSKGLHVPELKKTGKFNIKAAADIVVDNPFLEGTGIQDYYTDYKEMLKDPELDAIVVLSPHHLHEEHCVAAFNAGKHVLIEKPISRNLEEARNIIAAAEKSGKIGMIGFCQRFYKESAHIKKLIEENKIGQLLSARVDHYQNFNPAQGSWWRSKEKVGGGAVIGSGVHRLDLLRWYLGEAKTVYANGTFVPERLEAEACVHAVIGFDSGAVANFSINWASNNFNYYEGVEITGKDGLIVNHRKPDLFKLGHKDVEKGILQDIEASECQSMYDHFAECIETGKTPGPSLMEGYKTLQLVRAIYKSMETGNVVNVDEVTL